MNFLDAALVSMIIMIVRDKNKGFLAADEILDKSRQDRYKCYYYYFSRENMHEKSIEFPSFITFSLYTSGFAHKKYISNAFFK